MTHFNLGYAPAVHFRKESTNVFGQILMTAVYSSWSRIFHFFTFHFYALFNPWPFVCGVNKDS